VNRGGVYLLTWTTHGTRLPGDPRGFVSRVPSKDGPVIHNKVGTEYDRDMPSVLKQARKMMQDEQVWLSYENAECCALAFDEAASNAHARIGVYAIMPGHCHIVLHSPTLEGAELLRRVKGVSARRLCQQFGRPPALSSWTRNGSHRLLTTRPSIHGAIRYVLNQQKPLIVFRAQTLKPDPANPGDSVGPLAD